MGNLDYIRRPGDRRERKVTGDWECTVAVVGQLLGVSRQTVHAMLKDGRLPGKRVSDVINYVRKG